MKFVTEYRDQGPALKLSQWIRRAVTRPWTLMEVCGGQTHAILRFGLDELLPEELRLVHGPGCPVCVTPTAWIDKAIEIAGRKEVIFCSFGDMLRVPGTGEDLLSVKAKGGDVRIVYSPLDAVKLARETPTREVVFFAVGFETTAPATAQAAYEAKMEGLRNFSLLVCHVLVPPAMETLLSSPDNLVQGFLAAGHVCTVMGYEAYEPIARDYRVPIVVTGFEPLDILEGIYLCVKQLEEGRHEVENQYLRSVKRAGNTSARNLLSQVFEVIPRSWRGMGEIPRSGFGLSAEFRALDAETRFGKIMMRAEAESPCISGLILRGIKKPTECPAFGTICRPERPLGAPMVSTEGACAAYYRYRQSTAL